LRFTGIDDLNFLSNKRQNERVKRVRTLILKCEAPVPINKRDYPTFGFYFEKVSNHDQPFKGGKRLPAFSQLAFGGESWNESTVL
jgi:hypothetical protein